MRVVRNMDLVVLAIGLPVFLAAGLPILGWAATTGSWLTARWFQSYVEARALTRGTRNAVLGARAASLLGRLYFVTIAVFIAGLVERRAGLWGGVLAVAVFTAYFISLFVMETFEEDGR